MHNIKIEVDKSIDLSGASKRGTLTTTFNKLVERFGPPTKTGTGDTFNEWAIQFQVPDEDDFDYVIASIYDYHEESNPAENPSRIVTFMIGGFGFEASYQVHHVVAS